MSKARICTDIKDRYTLQNALQFCTHPLDLDSHDNNLLKNIYSGEIESSHNGSERKKERFFCWE